MSRTQIHGNYRSDRNTSPSYLKRPMMDVQNLIHHRGSDYKLPSDSKRLKEGALQYYPKLNSPRAGNDFPYALKHPKVYATRDFPKHCGPLLSQINENATKSLRNVKCEPVDKLASRTKNYDIERKISRHHLNEVVFESRDQEKVAAILGSLKPRKGNDGAKYKVEEALNQFRKLYKELMDEYKAEQKGGEAIGTRRFDVEAANWLKKKGKWIHMVKKFGHIPGIAIGDQFHYRAELAVVGLHCQYTSGIDYVVLDGKKFAISVVNSGRYENKAKTLDVWIYSGHGGNGIWGDKVEDQKLERGNLAMANSMEMGYPVRVIHKRKSMRTYDKGRFAYTYDGLYIVKKFWRERDRDRKFVFKFELHRIPGQEKLSRYSRKSTQTECCVVDDVSQGKENMPIRAMNGIDGEKPPTFSYMTNVIYPEGCKKIQHSGCNCMNGCSDSGKCLCISKNGGEIPYSQKGTILRQKEIVYECGPSCKCPPSCLNRVSQHGPKLGLEIYRTETGGWGVKSRSYISSGSFVCEYVGKLLEIKKDDDDARLDKGEMGFTVDASKMGNVGRFIRYSSSPNLFVQRVLYDHDDERMPHMMLFAAKNICPLEELTCDYDHQMNRIS